MIRATTALNVGIAGVGGVGGFPATAPTVGGTRNITPTFNNYITTTPAQPAGQLIDWINQKIVERIDRLARR